MNYTKATVLIKGRVQGVHFRAYIYKHALSLGLSGYVRNLPLRRVEAVFIGPRKTVEQAITWCHQGPPQANVNEVIVNWTDFNCELSEFEIRK